MTDNKITTIRPAKSGLGKGLSALIAGANTTPATTAAVATNMETQNFNRESLSVNSIEPSRFQPRKYFNEEELNELADSIKTNGVVQPIIVRQNGNNYELIAGERRWRAAKQAGLQQIPAIVMELTDRQAMEVALVENIQRQNLKPLEVAEGYQRLIEEFAYTQEQLAEVIGKSRGQVSNYLRLVELPTEVKDYINAEKISVGHAKILLSLPKEQVVELAKTIVKRNLNVRQTEKLSRRLEGDLNIKSQPKARGAAHKDTDIVELEKALSVKLGLNINITNKGNTGKVSISYNTLEQLDSILKRLEAN